MKWLKRIALTLVVLVVALCAFAFVMPSHAHVERSITIARPPATVFAVVDSFRRFNDWSPWAKMDPKATYEWSGPAAGVGAKLAWKGDPATVGSGSQTITAREPGRSMDVALEFEGQDPSRARFDLAADGAAGTRVTWSFDTDLPLAIDGKLPMHVMGRWFSPMFDSMIGKDYESGLAGLKTVVEALPAVDLAGFDAKAVQLPARALLRVSAQSGLDSASAGPVLANAYKSIGEVVKANDLAVQGAPMTITHGVDQGVWSYDAAIAVDREPAAANSNGVLVGPAQQGTAIETIHVGPYDGIPDTLAKLDVFLAAQGYKRRGELIAEYVDDPGAVPIGQVRTRIVQPVE